MLSSATHALPHRTSSRTRCVEIPSFHLWGMALHSVDALTLTLTLTSCATAIESVHRLSRSVIELRTTSAPLGGFLGKPFQRQLSPIPEVYIITNHTGAHPSLWSMGTPSITTCNNDGIDCLYQ